MQCFKLIVNDRKDQYRIEKILPKLQLKSAPVFLSKLQFIGVSRNNSKEKKHDFCTLQFCRKNWPNQPEIRMIYNGQSYTKRH